MFYYIEMRSGGQAFFLKNLGWPAYFYQTALHCPDKRIIRPKYQPDVIVNMSDFYNQPDDQREPANMFKDSAPWGLLPLIGNNSNTRHPNMKGEIRPTEAASNSQPKTAEADQELARPSTGGLAESDLKH